MALSAVLELLIGVAFIYLLLALVVTAVSEFIAALWGSRGLVLRRGISQLLGDDALVTKFYEHPLVTALRQPSMFRWRGGLNERSPVKKIGDAVDKKPATSMLKQALENLRDPSYIPSRTFATVVVELVCGPDALSDLQKAKTKVSALGASHLKTALETQINLADNKAEKFLQNLETWFNDSMDRVSGWYKRRAERVCLFLAVVVTMAFNADAVFIVRKLWQAPALRASLVAEAETFAKERAKQETATTADSNEERPNGPPPLTPDVQPEIDQAAARLYESVTRVESISFPLGWADWEDEADRASQLEKWPGWMRALRTHAWGWLISSFAIALGAPFWFDTLNRLIAVRSSGKAINKTTEKEKGEKK